jgi:hypothetical protein
MGLRDASDPHDDAVRAALSTGSSRRVSDALVIDRGQAPGADLARTADRRRAGLSLLVRVVG